MKYVSRRSFVRTVGAAAAALPFVNLTRGARVTAAPGDAPLRLVLWPSMNGADPNLFWPNAGNLAAMSVVTQPLAAYQKQITFLRGLDIAGSNNHMAIRSMFTGFPVADYLSPDPNVKSLDQVVRDVVQSSAPTMVPSLHLGARPADSYDFYKLYGRSTLFFASGSVDYEANPVSAFDRTFGGLPTGGGAPPPVQEEPSGPDPVRLRNAMLALQTSELEALRGKLVKSPLEVSRLTQHQAAMEKLVRDPDAVTPPTTPVTADGSPLASVEKLRSRLEGKDRDAYQDALFNDVFDAQVDIMARALVTGVTRVATLQAGSADGNVIVPIDGGYPHHNSSHGSQEIFARIQQYYARKLARLLAALDVPDPLDPSGKTVLYNSAIVWLSECMPVDHGSADVPCFVAGNAGGRLDAGKLINVEGATNKHLLRTLANVFGADSAASSHFGSDILGELTT
jgi:hypothetical protein